MPKIKKNTPDPRTFHVIMCIYHKMYGCRNTVESVNTHYTYKCPTCVARRQREGYNS